MSEPEPLTIEMGTGELAGIATVVIEQAGRPVVVLDHDLILRLDRTLDALPPQTRGLVLASAGDRAFIAGADLHSIYDWPDDRLARYLENGARVFARIAGLPCPTAAAINGAALGGGLELALHCDGLIAAPAPTGKPYPVGLPEAALGICPGWGGTQTLPARVEPQSAIRRTCEGKPFTFDEARAAGLFDLVVKDPAALRDAARRWVLDRITPERLPRDGSPLRWNGRPPRGPEVLAALDAVRPDLPATGSAEAVFAAVDLGLAGGWAAGLELERARLIELRRTPEAREAIGAFLAKSRG